MDVNGDSTRTFPRGSRENPFSGIPDVTDPIHYDDADLAALVGRRLTSAWFTISPDAELAFVRGTFLDRVYQDLGDESIVEGFYLLALLDPLLASVVRHRDKQETALNYGVDGVRFTSPVHPVDVLQAEFTLAEVSVRPAGQLVRWHSVLHIAGRATPALVTDWLVLFPAPTEATTP